MNLNLVIIKVAVIFLQLVATPFSILEFQFFISVLYKLPCVWANHVSNAFLSNTKRLGRLHNLNQQDRNSVSTFSSFHLGSSL